MDQEIAMKLISEKDPIKGLPILAEAVAKDYGTPELADMMECMAATCQDYGWKPEEVKFLKVIVAKAVLAAACVQRMRQKGKEEAQGDQDTSAKVDESCNLWMQLCAEGDLGVFLKGLTATLLMNMI